LALESRIESALGEAMSDAFEIQSPNVAALIHRLSVVSTSSPISDPDFLSALLRCGFASVRYYDIAQATARAQKILVLSASSGSRNAAEWVGCKIPFSETTLANSGDITRPAVGTANMAELLVPEGHKKWISRFKLEGHSWVDIPLISEGELLGLVALDWVGAPDFLDSHARLLLELIGSRISRGFETYSASTAVSIRDAVEKIAAQADDEQSFVVGFCSVILKTFHNAIASVFEYDWTTESLRKVHEELHPSLGRFNELLEENYHVGSYLTGTAWRSESHRHIFDFDTFRLGDAEKVYEPSFERHSQYAGKITSVYYQIVGEAGKRFMIRLLNRCDDKRLPITATEVNVLKRVGSDITSKADRISSIRRLTSLQTVSTELIHRFDLSTRSLHILSGHLKDEGIKDFLVLCHNADEATFCFEYYSDENVLNSVVLLGKIWSEVEFYAKRCHSDNFVVSEIKDQELVEDCLSGKLAKYLAGRNYRKMLVIPIRAGGVVRGIFAVLGSEIVRVNLSSALVSVLKTYASIIGSAIEAEDSHITHDRARKLVAYIGHEITSPVVTIRSKAKTAIEIARTQFDSFDREAQESLLKLEQQVNQIAGEVRQTLTLAEIVAQQASGQFELAFREEDLSRILLEAQARMEPDLTGYDQGRVRLYQFQTNDACHRLGPVVCDETYLRQAIINLLKNAIKFSFPKHPNQPMVIEIQGQRRSTGCILKVVNWGIGIPSNERERIFRPFVRGSVLDNVRRRGGMGLGLYLSRQIVEAHNGQVICADSVPTFSDPEKVRKYEGYLTTFELRIPSNNTPGVFNYAMKEKRQ
jgi:signal transduction histidine kinase